MTSQEETRLPQGSQPGRPPVRLRDSRETLQEPSARWAVSLIRAAKPHEPIPAGQDRVWANLHAVTRSRRTRWVRLSFATTLVLVAGLFVSGALAQWPGWLARAIHGTPAEGRAPAPSQRSAAGVALPTTPSRSPIPVPETAAAPPASTPEAPATASSQGQVRSRSRLATPEESQVLLEAMRALRIERSPSRARAMLEAYLARHPKGALAEEALVMLVEAAAIHGDADAKVLAARYFAQYPRGAFADEVRRALRNAAPAPP